MQALSDEQQTERLEGRMERFDARMNRLEKKMEDGFAAIHSESRADFGTLLGVQLTMLMAMILGFAGILLQHL
jgi:hypothetical protein